MNKSNLKKVLIIIALIAICIAITWVFVSILPWLLVGGIIIWLIAKIVKKVKRYKYQYEDDKDCSKGAEQYYSEDNIDVSEAIDVEYKEIDK